MTSKPQIHFSHFAKIQPELENKYIEDLEHKAKTHCIEANMLTNLMGMLWEEGGFFLDAISDHPGIIFAIPIVAFFLFLLLKVAIFNMIFF